MRTGWGGVGAGSSRNIFISNFKLAWGRRESRGLKMYIVENIEKIQKLKPVTGVFGYLQIREIEHCIGNKSAKRLVLKELFEQFGVVFEKRNDYPL